MQNCCVEDTILNIMSEVMIWQLSHMHVQISQKGG